MTASALFLTSGRPPEARAGLVLSVEAPGVQTTSQANVTTETFSGFSPYGGTGANGAYTTLSSSIGTFSSSGMAIVSADSYGGGTGNYFAVGSESQQSTATLTFKAPVAFFGFMWSAADSYNQIAFYSGTQLLGSFNPTTALSALGSSYYGNPNNRSQDAGEKFAYIDFTDTDGPLITSIVFQNLSLGSGFEIDNMSISKAQSVPTGTLGIPGGISTIPEPSSFMMLGLSMVFGIGGLGVRRRLVENLTRAR